MNRILIAVAVSLLISQTSLAISKAVRPPVEYQVAVEEFLAEARTQATIRDRVGIRAERCVESSVTTKLCQWSLRDRESGWQPLARAIRTRDRVSLVCELPIDESPRVDGSCTAHPQRSNRSMFTPKGAGPGRNPKGGLGKKRAASRGENQMIAQSWLDGAHTLAEMSHLLGALPSICDPPANGERVCVWRATARIYGHGTIAASIKAAGGKKVRLHCRFPVDGSGRAPDSCDARIGS
jgi:hypothetical protein